MEKIPKMVDISLEPPSEDTPVATNLSIPPQYPYGTQLCLNDYILKKLDMDDDCEVGDHFHGHFLAKVTSVSSDERSGKRVEMQIVALSAEDEDQENEEAEEEYAPPYAHRKAVNPYE